MRKITPLPGACIEVHEDGTIRGLNWQIDGETDADDPTSHGRLLAVIDYVRARVVSSREDEVFFRAVDSLTRGK